MQLQLCTLWCDVEQYLTCNFLWQKIWPSNFNERFRDMNWTRFRISKPLRISITYWLVHRNPFNFNGLWKSLYLGSIFPYMEQIAGPWSLLNQHESRRIALLKDKGHEVGGCHSCLRVPCHPFQRHDCWLCRATNTKNNFWANDQNVQCTLSFSRGTRQWKYMKFVWGTKAW